VRLLLIPASPLSEILPIVRGKPVMRLDAAGAIPDFTLRSTRLSSKEIARGCVALQSAAAAPLIAIKLL
jgi:hypothetical protein